VNLQTVLDNSNVEPRPYQERIITKSVDMFEGKYKNAAGEAEIAARSVMLESPTGSGKTVMGLTIAKLMQERHGLRIGWVAMRRNLLKQAAKENIDKGINVDMKMISMFEKYPPKDIDMLVVDESQHDAAQSMVNLHSIIQPKKILGMTATPYRTDRVKLCFDRVIRDAGIHSLIQDGYLSQYHHYTMDSYTPEMVANQYALHTGLWGKTLMFFLQVEECYQTQQYLLRKGIPSEVVTAKTDRDQQIDNFNDGKVNVLLNCAILTEGFDCLDSETEVLAPSGWKSYDSIQNESQVYGMNLDTNKLEIVDVDSVGKRNLKDNEKFVEIKSQHVNVRVTESHNLFVKYKDPKTGKLSDNTLCKKSKELVTRKSSYALPLSAELTQGFKGLDISNDEVRLIAWFMTDGWLEGKYKSDLYIGQSKENRIVEIRSLLDRLNVDYTEKVRSNRKGCFDNQRPCHMFRIPRGTGTVKKNGWGHLQQYMDKNVSPLLHQMTKEQFLVFWGEALKGDGNKTKNRSGWLWCTTKKQADEYTHMAVVRGLSASCAPFDYEKNGKAGRIWRVSVRDKQWITSDPSDSRSASVELTNPSKGEYVWCLKNRLGTIITRRRGKIVILGNCPDLKTVFVRPSGKGPTVQMGGRVFRKWDDLPFKQIVQCKKTRHPFMKTATPEQRFVWVDGWRSLTENPLVGVMNMNARMAIARTEVELPEILNKKRELPSWSDDM